MRWILGLLLTAHELVPSDLVVFSFLAGGLTR